VTFFFRRVYNPKEGGSDLLNRIESAKIGLSGRRGSSE
jgi:hypothetical protein